MRSFDNAFEDAEQAAWEQHYRWEWEQEQQAKEVDDWLASESPEEIWRVWDAVAACSDEWCDLAKQVTIAVLAGKDAQQIAINVMREVFLKEFNIWRKA
jgi:hypothetical protein